MSSRIKDVAEFCRLYHIRIPVEQEFDYYTSTLARSPYYIWLKEAIAGFRRFELSPEGTNPGSFKMDKVIRLKNFLLESATFEAFQQAQPGPPVEERNDLNNHAGQFLLSLDLEMANFGVLKSFDSRGELPGTWADLCTARGIPPMLHQAKTFRQLVFGHLEPKKCQAFQRWAIADALGFLLELGIRDQDIVLLSADEIVIRMGKAEKIARDRSREILPLVEALNREKGGPLPAPLRGNLKFRPSVFRMHPLDRSIFVKEEFEALGGAWAVKHASLVGVPGNQFYMYFKRHILGEGPEERDLLFYSDNHLARWVVDDEMPSR